MGTREKMAATKEQLQEIRDTFKNADKDGSGKLNLGELEKLVIAMPGMKKEYAEMILKHADHDRDMLINYGELLNMFEYDDPEDRRGPRTGCTTPTRMAPSPRVSWQS